MDPSRIVGAAEWYYKRWPKFYNKECYQILADFTAHPKKYTQQEGVGEKKDSNEECKDVEYEENKNRKRKVCVCGFNFAIEQCEHVVSV